MNQFMKNLLALVVFGACIGSSFADDDANINSILDQLPLDNLPDLSSFDFDFPPDLPLDLVEPGQEAYAAACWAVGTSSGLRIRDIDRADEWMDDETSLELHTTGNYVGAKDIAEYVSFVTDANPFLDYYRISHDDVELLPISFTADTCNVAFVAKAKLQITPKYANGEKHCFELVQLATNSYSVDLVKHFNPLTDDSGYKLKRSNILYPDDIPVFELFGGDATTDFVCNDVLRDSCPEVYEANGLDEESCKAKFEALPADENGYLDSNSRGCRTMHAAFAKNNKEHCSHLSFLPMEDDRGRIKCQVSRNRTKEDLFPPEQLEFYQTAAVNLGFSADRFWRPCDYVEPETAAEEPAAEEPAAEEPAAEEPAVEEPAVEEPAVELDDSAAATGTSVNFLLLMLFACVIF